VSRRLAEALAESVRRMSGGSAFIAMEGVSVDFASALVGAWKRQDALPKIAVVGAPPDRVGDAALRRDMTPTTLRGQYPEGFFLVQIEGHRIEDAASVGKLVRLRLADLTTTAEGYSLLTQVEPEPPGDGPARAVRDALTTSVVDRPPPPERVAAYLDSIASGQDPLDALPKLGAFVDPVSADAVDANRIAANLRLAGLRRTDAVLSGSNLAGVRTRAHRLFREKFGNEERVEKAVSTLIEQLRTADDAVLTSLTFDEARAVLEGPTQQHLATQAVEEIEAWVRERERRQQASDPSVGEAGEMIEAARRDLDRASERREAARRLVEFHLGAEPHVFSDETLKRLYSLLKEPRITVSRPEEGLTRAVLAIGRCPTEVILREPRPHEDLERPSDQRRALSLLCARLRLARLLTQLEDRGCRVPAALRESLNENDIELLRLSAPERGFPSLDTVQIVVRGEGRSEEWRFGWKPNIEDLAILNALFAFASEPTLAFRSSAPSVSGLGGRFAGDAVPVKADLFPLAEACRNTASMLIKRGYDAAALRRWAQKWRHAVTVAEEHDASREALDALALAGTVHDANRERVLLTPLAPMKAEWLADRADGWQWLLMAALGEAKLREDDEREPPIAEAADALASLRAAGYPPSLSTSDRDDALLASDEGEVISVFGSLEQGALRLGDERGVVRHAFQKFIDLHPESSADFRCVAWGDTAPDAALGAMVDLLGSTGIGGRPSASTIRQGELICVGGKPSELMLEEVDDLSGEDMNGRLSLRYGESLDDLRRELGGSPNDAIAHVSVVIGLTKSGRELTQEHPEVDDLPSGEPDALWGPRVWLRSDQLRRTLLAPPRTTDVGERWFRLMSAIGDRWPANAMIRVPELRTDAKSIRSDLQLLHELGSWVITVDRYAGRDALENALGEEVAILHQERRLASDNIQSLVISQKSGRSTDRAIARSLRDAQLVADDASAIRLAEAARRTAADWNGILALRAATTGSGVNELLGQVMAYSLLRSMASPWPFPPGFRVLLIGLDEYQGWFGRGRRADLLALSLDTEERGIHCAAIEVKAVRSTDTVAAFREAKEQLRATIADGRFAVSPDKSLFSRMWLNRIAEAAIGVARESNFRLKADELEAIEEFRTNRALEWAGVGLIFGQSLPREEQHPRLAIMGDQVPVSMYSFPIEDTLRYVWEAGSPGELRSEAVEHPMPESTKKRRARNGDEEGADEAETDVEGSVEETVLEAEAASAGEGEAGRINVSFEPPVLGVDVVTGEAVIWRISGEGALSAGHMEIYGTTGAGKTQFIKSVLKQLRHAGAHFSICDFKNDYEDSGFPQKIGAVYFDLWDVGAPFNPLALPPDNRGEREIERRVIELGDAMGTAAQTYPGMRLGHRQLGKLKDALRAAYATVRAEGRQPTLLDLNDLLDDDLRGIIGDLTRSQIFKDGPPFSEVINEDSIFGLQKIPGVGFTTDLAAGFILSSLALTFLDEPQVANLVKYVVVIDEAHRVSGFKAVSTMLREGRSKGLAVLMATQQPGDLPSEAEANAQTKICFRLPSGPTATSASRLLGATDHSLAERIQALEDGEAFVRFAGLPPKVVRMRQFWRDDD
jgi:Type IV secretion-system coupling protein DNA-binding domain